MGVVCGAAILVAVPLGLRTLHRRQEDASYQEQLRLARAEGLPTSAAEYAALILPARPSENAAHWYAGLRRPRGTEPGEGAVLGSVDAKLLFAPGAESTDRLRALIAPYRPQLERVDQAVGLPRCWFDRRWQGAATLFPEYAQMKTAARAVAVRGTIAAHEGRVGDAIADAERIFAIAGHAGEEPHAIARLVREAIFRIGVQSLAQWAFVHRDRRAYGEALEAAVQRSPRPNLKDEHRGDLYEVLSLVELCSTPEGRRELGLRDEDLPHGAEAIFPRLLSQSKARTEIVRAVRAGWAALDRPPGERASLQAEARHELFKALLAYPTAARVYEMLSSGGAEGDPPDRELVWRARHQMDVALARALTGPVIPRTLATGDLPSPFDGKPLEYEFDGRQIRLTVSGSEEAGGPKALEVPPDRALGG